MVLMSYEGSDDKEELKMLPVINQNNNNYYDIVSDSNGDNELEENFFDEEINDEFEATTKTTINAKVVQAKKKLQALYNNDANKIVKEAAQEKV